jgi:hypothetical protein
MLKRNSSSVKQNVAFTSLSAVSTVTGAIQKYEISSLKFEIWPYRWFKYALLVPTVARVHFLNLKALVCILISTGSTWDIGAFQKT